MLQLWEIGRSMTVNLWDGPKSPSQHWLDSEICAIIRGALTDNFEDHFFFRAVIPINPTGEREKQNSESDIAER
jgi:hypothetical protein